MTKEQFLKLKVGDKLTHPELGVYQIEIDINKNEEHRVLVGAIWRLVKKTDGETLAYICDDMEYSYENWNLYSSKTEITDLI